MSSAPDSRAAVPLIFFGYRRPDHLSKALRAAARNPLACSTPLYIFIDGPKGEKDRSDVLACQKAARLESGGDRWASVDLVISEKNQGLAGSVISGVSRVLSKHDSAIVLEDDLVVSPDFLAYMNAALARYSTEPSAFSVCGYCPPVRWNPEPPSDAFFFERCNSLGWGTWKDRWFRVDWSMEKTIALRSDPRLMRGFEKAGNDLPAMLGAQIRGDIHSWAVRWSLAHTEYEAYCLYPTRTFLENIGFDGSGTNVIPEIERVETPRALASFDPRTFRWPASAAPLPEISAQLRAHFSMPWFHYWRLRLTDVFR